jgi:hypothetical protein
MLKNSKEVFSLLQNLRWFTNPFTRRSLNTTPKKQGGAAHGGHGEHGQAKSGGILNYFKYPENPVHERRGYLYRELGNLQGSTPTTITRFGVVLAWWYIFYNLWAHFENVIGHEPYPDTSKWTDEELGIPPDDAE